MFSGKVVLAYHDDKPFLDYDRQEVNDIIDYLKSDRTKLPDLKEATRRAQAEANIMRLGLQKEI